MRTIGGIALLIAAAAAHAAGYPAYVPLPSSVKIKGEVEVESYGQVEFTLRDKTELVRGKTWRGQLDAASLGAQDKRYFAPFVDALARAGWQVLLRDEPRNPPLATFKLAKDGREAWAYSEGDAESLYFVVVERGQPTAKLHLEAPAAGIEKLADTADFPFLKRFPGAKLGSTSKEGQMLVALEADRDPVQVAATSVQKEYPVAPGTGNLEVIVVYREALKAAGWQVVHENIALTTGDPNVTAHYAKGAIDLWAHVHARGDRYTVTVGDAGGERAPSRLKAELDKTCKVAIYGVNFDFDKASLRPDSEAALASILKLLTDHGDLNVELGGHTDNVGKRDYNMKLSEARVNTVRGWLVGKAVKADRLTAKGYADTRPVDSNDTVEGRAKNRRVELRKAGCNR